MEERILETLVLEDNDYIFAGDLTIKGEVLLKNCSLIVSGVLTLEGNVGIAYGNIICGSLKSNVIYIIGGDIWVHKDIYNYFLITTNGNIEIRGNTDVGDIRCCNYLVDKNNKSSNITATNDIYIMGDSCSLNIKGREVFICGESDFNGCYITASYFEHGGEVKDCIGRLFP